MKPAAMIKMILGLLTIPLLPAACSLPQSQPKPVYYYTLAHTPLNLRMDHPLPVVLRVDRFTANPQFNTQQIIYGDKGLHRNAYANFKWIALPGELLSYGLARDLQQCNGFQAVLTPQAALPPTHTLSGYVEEFLEEDYTRPAQASLRLNITLIDARQTNPVKRILFQKAYAAKAPCAGATPADLAQAMSAAAAQIDADIIRDVYQCLAMGR